MKFCIAIALVLFVGLLAETTSMEIKTPRARDLLGKVRRVSKIKAGSGAVRVTRSTEDSDEDDFVAACLKNGGPDAYSIAEEKIEEALVQFVLDVDENGVLEQKFTEANETDNYGVVISHVCYKKNDVIKFTNAVVTASKPCLDDDEKLGLDFVVNLANSFIGHVCKDNGTSVTNFLTSGGLDCLSDKERELEGCVETLLDDSSEETDATVAVNTIESNDECGTLNVSRTCIKNVLKTCPDPTNANFVVGLIDFFVQPLCAPTTAKPSED